MSRTNLYFTNNSSETLVLRTPPCEPTYYDGSDWEKDDHLTIPSKGTTIAPGQRILLGSMGDPGNSEGNHWGWIFLYSEVHDDFIQCYLISKGDNDSRNVAAFDWYQGKRISDGDTNVSESKVGTVSKVNGDFTLTYHPTEEDPKLRAKLPFDLSIASELLETQVLDPSKQKLTRANVYALTVRIGPNPIGPQGLKLSATSPVSVALRGGAVASLGAGAVSLDSSATQVIAVPPQGTTFTIQVPASTLSSTTLHLDFPNPNHPSITYRVPVHPASLAVERLTSRGYDPAALRSAGSTRNAGALSSVEAMINQLKGVERHLPKDGTAAGPGYVIVQLQANPVAQLQDPRLHTLRDCCFGLSIEGDAVRYHEDAAARGRIDECKKRCKERGIDSGVVTTFDGIWDKIKDGLGTIKEFFVNVINQVIHIVVQIGEFIYNAVMTIASEAVRAITWVLENVLGITMDDVVAWLGHAFDWTEIKKAQKQIVTWVANGFAELRSRRPEVLARVADLRALLIQVLGLESYDNRLRFKEGALQGLGATFDARRRDCALDQYKSNTHALKTGDTDVDTDAPQVRWASEAVAAADTSPLADYPALAALASQAGAVFQRFVDDAKAFIPDLEATAELVVGYFREVTLDTLLDALRNAFLQLATGVVSLIEKATDLVINLLFGLLDLTFQALNLPIPVPFLGALYRAFIDPSVPSPSLLDQAALLVAIPATVLSDWIFDKSIFDIPGTSAPARKVAVRRVQRKLTSVSNDTAMAMQTAAGFVTGVCQVLSSVFYTIMEVYRIEKNTAMIPVPLLAKIAVDCIGYGSSLVSLGFYLKANSEGSLSARQVLDIVVGVVLGVPRVTDFLRFWSFMQGANPVVDGAWLRERCGRIDTVVAAGGLVVLFVDLGLNAGELPSGSTRRFEQGKLALKGTQLIMALLNPLLAWPRESLANTDRRYEVAIAITRAGIQLSNGVLVLARTSHNLAPNLTPRYTLHGAIYA